MPRLYVGGLVDRVGHHEIEQMFDKFGKVSKVQTGFAGFAFVEMETENDAEKAINELNGVQLYGQKLTVQPARGDEREEQELREAENGRETRDSRFRERVNEPFLCYNCNRPGHLARDCTAKPRNPLYLDTRGTKISDVERLPPRYHPYTRSNSPSVNGGGGGGGGGRDRRGRYPIEQRRYERSPPRDRGSYDRFVDRERFSPLPPRSPPPRMTTMPFDRRGPPPAGEFYSGRAGGDPREFSRHSPEPFPMERGAPVSPGRMRPSPMMMRSSRGSPPPPSSLMVPPRHHHRHESMPSPGMEPYLGRPSRDPEYFPYDDRRMPPMVDPPEAPFMRGASPSRVHHHGPREDLPPIGDRHPLSSHEYVPLHPRDRSPLRPPPMASGGGFGEAPPPYRSRSPFDRRGPFYPSSRERHSSHVHPEDYGRSQSPPNEDYRYVSGGNGGFAGPLHSSRRSPGRRDRPRRSPERYRGGGPHLSMDSQQQQQQPPPPPSSSSSLSKEQQPEHQHQQQQPSLSSSLSLSSSSLSSSSTSSHHQQQRHQQHHQSSSSSHSSKQRLHTPESQSNIL